MAVRLVPCRHKVTGAYAEIPETALGYVSDFEPIEDAETDAQAEPEHDTTSGSGGGSGGGTADAAKATETAKVTKTPSKPKAGTADKTEE